MYEAPGLLNNPHGRLLYELGAQRGDVPGWIASFLAREPYIAQPLAELLLQGTGGTELVRTQARKRLPSLYQQLLGQ